MAPTSEALRALPLNIGAHVRACKSSPKKEVIAIKQMKLSLPVPEGYVVKFVAYITLKNGKRLYAKAFGKRAFPLIVKA